MAKATLGATLRATPQRTARCAALTRHALAMFSLSIGLGLGLHTNAIAASKLFCCIDANAKQICGDTMPQACYGRAYRELGDSGRTVRQVEAPLNAEQREQRAQEDEQYRKAEEARKEQQRKDQALLNTYGTEKDIDILRARAQQDVKTSIAAAETRISEIRKQREKYEEEAEFYKKKQMPADVQKGLRTADFEIQAQESIVEAKQKELEIIRVKYDEDKRRYQALTQSRAASRPR